MSRSYATGNLVALPILSASSAITLVTEILTAAKAQQVTLSAMDESLAAVIERARAKLDAANQELAAIVMPQTDSSDSQAGRKADRVLDNAWSAAHAFLSGWCKLPPDSYPGQENAFTLFNLLFPDDLSFTQKDYKSEWQESQSRIDAVRAEQLEPAFDQLGGKVFLEHIVSSQKTYGDVLGITAVKVDESSPEVREKMSATLSALRSYVTKVVALADPEEVGTEALSEALLAPLVAWE